ncbi:MAG TPA: fatty acid desaturase [Chthoniobacteraceae bacterium]|nr:fatty acid desaturase [Chthoniobacteraceae bacterium]
MDISSEPHEPHWISRAAFGVISLGMLAGEAALWWAVYHQWYWLAVLLVPIVSHLFHGQLIGFHEASHGLLRKNRKINEIDGVLLGTFSFVSFSLYRAAHQLHHAQLGTQRDEEFWPFTDPKVPRWARIFAAVAELFAGLVVTPLIFARTFLRAGSPIRSSKVRRRIWSEWVLTAVVWTAVLGAVAYFGVWKYFLWMYLAPAVIAANLQSWRKYIEHVGMTGSTPNGITRSVVADTWHGRLMAFSLLHEPFHGVHHQHAGVPHAGLPRLVSSLEPKAPGERPPFPSYRQALVDLVRGLGDPRVGPQWRVGEAPKL